METNRTFGRVTSILLVAGGWMLAGGRAVLDLIGYSTIPEDVSVAKTRLSQIVELVLSIPWWAILGLVLISTLVLMWVSWPRPASVAMDEDTEQKPPSPRPVTRPEIYEGAHEQLMLFVCNRLLPACETLLLLQERAIRTQCDNGLISNFAVNGGITRPFREHFFPLRSLGDSPTTFIPFEEMIEHVHFLELNYHGIPTQISLILKHGGKSVSDFLSANGDLYKTWQELHEVMVSEYEAIKQNSKMGRLFRPARPSRWRDGVIIEA